MLAVVIPYYKITYFKDTLQSLASQTNSNFQVYIGNDASPEDPRHLIENFEGEINITYKVFENNLGALSLTRQWERCIEMVQEEEWIVILGDDDVLSINYVSSFYASLKEVELYRINVIRYASANIDSEGNIISKIFKHPHVENSINFLFRKLQGRTRSSLSEYVFKTQIVKEEKFKNFPLAWFSDLLAVLEFSNFGVICTLNSSIVYFRFSNENISGRSDNLKEKNKATFLFYKYLVIERSYNFTMSQKDVFFNKMDNCVVAHKKDLKLFTEIFMLYFSKGLFRRNIGIIKKYLNSLFKMNP